MKSLTLAAVFFFIACENSFSQISASLDQPQCYEGVGCPHQDRITQEQARDLPCDNLWLVRNTIFHQRGFCFQTARGRKEFDNRRCSANSVAELKLSEVEKANVATLEKVERGKNCQ